MSLKIDVPLYIDIPRKTKKAKRYYLNLNCYRNWHHIINNKLKSLYKESLRDILSGVVLETPISITFTLFKSSNRMSDRANVLAVHEKYFCDSLVEFGCIPDDNDDYISFQKYKSGGVCKDNPRVEIEIETNSKEC